MAIQWKFWERSKVKETRRIIQANDATFNAQFEYADNYVTTSKYHWLTFLPLNLFEQFRRLANAYFLGLLVLQLVPQISSLTPITTILPLGFVILLKAVKDAIDDWTRHANDRMVNTRPTYVLRNGAFVSEQWCKINVGEIIKLENDDFVAADLLLMTSSEPHGLCYIETAELDGETNLKVKQAVSEIYKKFQSRAASEIGTVASGLAFKVECEPPNEVLNEFEGTLTWANGETVSLDNDKMLLRGCRLRNTKWCYGLVVFAGADTKLMKNGGKAKFKQTHIDSFLNKLIIGIVGFLLVMCVLCTIGCGFWESFYGYRFRDYLPWEDYLSENRHLGSTVIAALVFFSYIIILNTVVPISLYVSVEFIRLMQSFFINWDEKMYYEKNDIAAKARSTTLNEELGQIEYIFSDKTGTLTQNIMTFNKCSINGRLYGYLYDASNNEIPITDSTTPLDLSWNRYAEPKFMFYDRKLVTDIKRGDEHCHRFFTLLAVCHTVMAEVKESGALEYQAQSPDEAALVSAARNFGFVFKSRTPRTITIDVHGRELTYEVLNILDFNNVRKRMSVICQLEGKYILFCKGADTVIKERLDQGSMRLFEQSEEHLNKFADDALRTLCLAWKEIPEAEYKAWAVEYHKASTSLEDRAGRVSDVYEAIERDLRFIGSTAIEDKLQDGVPECIAKLAKANIKIWVLTGDKQETAINIGYSCRLLTNSMDVHILESNSEPELLMEINRLRNLVAENAKKSEFDREYQRVAPTPANPAVTFRGGQSVGPAQQSPSPTLMIEQSLTSDLTENALVVNGQTLVYALSSGCEKEFLDLACMCKAVICCRVTPGQKKAVVDLVKTHKKAITLAVGDGANDVSMIKSAHIGVGISGQEGQQAVLSSDFSIGQFRYLERLLLVHGRWSYYRISKFLRYFFYKNFASTLCHFWFAFFCGFSAQALFDPFFQSTYNVFFSSLPVLALGVFDQDVSEEMSVKYPALYVPGQKGELFNLREFILSVVHGIISSVILFFVPYGTMYMSVHFNGDNADDLQSFGFTIATILVVVVNLQCGLETSYWTFFNHFSIWGTLVVHFLFHFLLYSEFVYEIFGFNYFFVGTAQEVASTGIFWFTLLLTCVLLLLPIIGFFFVKSYFKPTISDTVRVHMKRTKTRTQVFRRSDSYRRSTYAYSHQEGFGRAIMEGLMMRDDNPAVQKAASRSFLAANPSRLHFHA